MRISDWSSDVCSSDLNRDGNLSHDQVKHAETIETSGNDLLLLINDILDISKIEAGHVELQPRRVRIAPLTEKLTATFGPMATKKDLTLRMDISTDAPDSIETAPTRLAQVRSEEHTSELQSIMRISD